MYDHRTFIQPDVELLGMKAVILYAVPAANANCKSGSADMAVGDVLVNGVVLVTSTDVNVAVTVPEAPEYPETPEYPEMPENAPEYPDVPDVPD